MYYIEKKNEIVLFDIDRKNLKNNIDEFYPQFVELPIQERDENIVRYNNKYYFESDIENELIKQRKNNFNKEFFNTSLGYVKRNVTIANGSHKDFLTDLLPAISLAVSKGKTVNIFTYDKPPFTQDNIDWNLYQHKVIVTPQFIDECLTQLDNDFLPQL